MSQISPAGALPAKQERSQETARRIVDAVETLLKRKAFDQLTMIEIAREAGLTPGAIYRRFENKEALLPHIFDRYRLILSAWMERISADAVLAATSSFEESVELVTRETFKSFKDNAHIFRTVHLYGRLHPEARESGDGTENRSFAPLDGIVAFYSANSAAKRKQSVQMMGHVLLSSVIERTLYKNNLPAAAVQLSDRKFIKSLAAMISAATDL